MEKRTSQRWGPVITVIVLLLVLFLVRQCRGEKEQNPKAKTEKASVRGLNRQPAAINYSKHALCRMECRHIDKAEVQDILENGKINYAKSEIGDRPDCKRKYAVEGTTRDQQRVRIIFAPCKEELTVVTVIDIGKEWPCECE